MAQIDELINRARRWAIDQDGVDPIPDITAAIEAATEQRIRAALKEVTSDRATVIISHRLSSLMHADEILFLEDGMVVERGSHDALVALDGRYADLYRLQTGERGAA